MIDKTCEAAGDYNIELRQTLGIKIINYLQNTNTLTIQTTKDSISEFR